MGVGIFLKEPNLSARIGLQLLLSRGHRCLLPVLAFSSKSQTCQRHLPGKAKRVRPQKKQPELGRMSFWSWISHRSPQAANTRKRLRNMHWSTQLFGLLYKNMNSSDSSWIGRSSLVFGCLQVVPTNVALQDAKTEFDQKGRFRSRISHCFKRNEGKSD